MSEEKSWRKVCVEENEGKVIEALCKYVCECANKAIADHGLFYVGVSGGSLANFLAKGLPQLETDWTKWRIFFCDERHVEYDDSDSTYRVYKEGLLSKVPLSDEHVIKINPKLSVEEAAADYIVKMKSVFGDGCDWPVFDLLLLGMGPDGHTCSLFPGHPLLQEQSVWIAPIKDSPKPPPSRITMTFPVLNRAKHAAFAACGQGKAAMVQRVLEGTDDPPLPASMVKCEDLRWFLDQSAASLVNKL